MYLRIKWAAYGIVAGVLLAAMVYLATRNLTRETAPARIVDAASVVHEIQRLNELVSVKYTIQKVVGLEETRFRSEARSCCCSCRRKCWPASICPLSRPAM